MCGLFIVGILVGYWLRPSQIPAVSGNEGSSVDVVANMCSNKIPNPEALLQIHSLLPSKISANSLAKFIRYITHFLPSQVSWYPFIKHYNIFLIFRPFENDYILTNSVADDKLVAAITSAFESSSFSKAFGLQYLSVATSLPSSLNPNTVQMFDSYMQEIFFENFTTQHPPPYVAYSASGSAKVFILIFF
jgi:hypothetical protein